MSFDMTAIILLCTSLEIPAQNEILLISGECYKKIKAHSLCLFCSPKCLVPP